MLPPQITLPHTVKTGQGALRIYPVVHRPFMVMMGKLYPTFAGYNKADVGYSGFLGDTFVGCCAGLTLQSVRKNPWFKDDNMWFTRFLLGSIHIAGHTRHSSVCSADNYGTLRLWQRLGLGAKIDARGKARTAALTLESEQLLSRLVTDCQASYLRVRRHAHNKTAGMPLAIQAGAIPRRETFIGSDFVDVDVEVGVISGD